MARQENHAENVGTRTIGTIVQLKIEVVPKKAKIEVVGSIYHQKSFLTWRR